MHAKYHVNSVRRETAEVLMMNVENAESEVKAHVYRRPAMTSSVRRTDEAYTSPEVQRASHL